MFKIQKMNLTQLAAYYNVTRQTVYNWIEKGMPYETTPSGRKIVDYDEVEQWIKKKEGK